MISSGKSERSMGSRCEPEPGTDYSLHENDSVSFGSALDLAGLSDGRRTRGDSPLAGRRSRIRRETRERYCGGWEKRGTKHLRRASTIDYAVSSGKGEGHWSRGPGDSGRQASRAGVGSRRAKPRAMVER